MRDAIHVATLTGVAGEDLESGEMVTYYDGVVHGCELEQAIGVVDPFCNWRHKGSEVTVWLKPGLVEGMRHEWTCPLLDSKVEGSQGWLEAFALRYRIPFQEMVEDAIAGRDLLVRGRSVHSFGDLGDDGPNFWLHMSAYTGMVFTLEHQGRVEWSCTC